MTLNMSLVTAVLSVLGLFWLGGAAVWLVLFLRWARARNRRGGRLGKYLSCSHPEWN